MKFAFIFFLAVAFASCQNNRPASYEYSDSTTVRKRTQVNPRDSAGSIRNTSHQDSATFISDTANEKNTIDSIH